MSLTITDIFSYCLSKWSSPINNTIMFRKLFEPLVFIAPMCSSLLAKNRTRSLQSLIFKLLFISFKQMLIGTKTFWLHQYLSLKQRTHYSKFISDFKTVGEVHHKFRKCFTVLDLNFKHYKTTLEIKVQLPYYETKLFKSGLANHY